MKRSSHKYRNRDTIRWTFFRFPKKTTSINFSLHKCFCWITRFGTIHFRLSLCTCNEWKLGNAFDKEILNYIQIGKRWRTVANDDGGSSDGIGNYGKLSIVDEMWWWVGNWTVLWFVVRLQPSFGLSRLLTSPEASQPADLLLSVPTSHPDARCKPEL